MKRKFLITNDVGLSLDKVNSVIDIIRAEDGFEYENLNFIDDTLIEVLEHLQQALDNLDSEEDGMKNYEIIVETKELHRLESTGYDEQEAIGKALSLLDIDVPLSNRSVSYSIMDVVLKDLYV